MPLRLFLTASYDGSVRVFDYSQKELIVAPLHSAPITAVCVVSSDADSQSHIIATASQDLTAQLARINVNGTSQALATMHLHTQSLSSIASNASGSQVLTASWDSLIGIWDTKIPSVDEVPEEPLGPERKKRRKVDAQAEKPKRKAPVGVLKSHTARISRVLFGELNTAYSCGFDSTIRVWDLENEVCSSTIVSGSILSCFTHQSCFPECIGTAFP